LHPRGSHRTYGNVSGTCRNVIEGAIRGFRQHFLTSVTGRNLFQEQAKRGEVEPKEAHRTYGNVSGTYRNVIEGAIRGFRQHFLTSVTGRNLF